MTPQEKAYEIWQKMMNADVLVDSISAKQCALIAVDEIIASMPKEPMISTLARVHVIMFWVEVKQEIEKL